MRHLILPAALLALAHPVSAPLCAADDIPGVPWVRHTIDSSSRGADGVRLGDVNGDGLPDFVTGWEQGGRIRVCLNPGPQRAGEMWPSVTVGKVKSPEDAVFADLDGDGALDVVSSCEGGTQTMFVHWGPRERAALLDETAWTTQPLPATEKRQHWMFCLPFDVDGTHGIDLITGSKGNSAAVGWLQAPADPRDLSAWTWRPLCQAGWIMSLCAQDMDGDADFDVLLTDRRGRGKGCKWLENPGRAQAAASEWPAHLIGGADHEMMFLTQGDLDQDGLRDVAAATRDDVIVLFRRLSADGLQWQTRSLPMPAGSGNGKAVDAGDLDLDGRLDLVLTCENSQARTGVLWLSADGPVWDAAWRAHTISGPAAGTKYDLIRLLDLDSDGDLDVVTCEERDNLGVIWYENPRRARK
jgi:hypothetical protein